MSDDDEDWSSDGEEDTGIPPPQVPATPLPVAARSSTASSSPQPTASQTVAVPAQQAFLGIPVQLSLKTKDGQPSTAAVGVACVMYDTSKGWALLIVDGAKRPLLYEPLDGPTQSAKALRKCKALCDMELLDGAWMEMVDRARKTLRLQFQTRPQAIKLLAFIALAGFCSRVAAISSDPTTLVEVVKGTGKSAKHFAHAQVQAWLVRPNSQSASVGVPQGGGLAAWEQSLDNNKPDLQASQYNVVVKEREETTPGGAWSLGHVLSRMKVEGERLVVCALLSGLGQEFAAELCASLDDRTKASTLVVALVRLTATLKKKDKQKSTSTPSSPDKTERRKKEAQSELEQEHKTALSDSPAGSHAYPHTAHKSPAKANKPKQRSDKRKDEDDDDEDFSEDEEEAGVWDAVVSAAPVSPPTQPTVTTEQVQELVSSFKALNSQVGALGQTQTKIIKNVTKTLYAGLLEDLRPDEEGIATLQTHLQQVVSGWQTLNTSRDSAGTVATLSSAMKTTLSLLRPFLTQGGPLTVEGVQGSSPASASIDPTQLHALQAAMSKKHQKQLDKVSKEANKEKSKLQKKAQQMESELSEVRLDKEKLRLEIQHLQNTTQQLTQQVAELKKENMAAKKAVAEVDALRRKAEEAKMFEAAVTDMRKMLDNEVEAKQEAYDALTQLSSIQKKLKVTWIPAGSVKNCLSCGDGFSMWGSKAQDYCRFCGRIFCKACCQKGKIPELGFNEEVRICNNCVSFRSQQ
eukprot:gb/GEZN01002426.1/.p1 GENE.gb/GEZN01002426.1/~~gb/GEZN01002426.1/.p1  ORF type:complete len:746 (-),score=195.52 gb/GEZN01002426.1/:214-2451(-)